MDPETIKQWFVYIETALCRYDRRSRRSTPYSLANYLLELDKVKLDFESTDKSLAALQFCLSRYFDLPPIERAKRAMKTGIIPKLPR